MGSWEDDSSYQCGQVGSGRLLSREAGQGEMVMEEGERDESMFVGCYTNCYYVRVMYVGYYRIIMYYQHACMHAWLIQLFNENVIVIRVSLHVYDLHFPPAVSR